MSSSISGSSSSTTVTMNTNATRNSNAAVGGVMISQYELDDLRDAFQLFDLENNGYVLLKGLRDILQSVVDDVGDAEAISVPSTKLKDMKRLLKATRSMPDDKRIDLDEFIKLMTLPVRDDKRSEFRKVFDLFDEAGKGFIDIEDLRRVAAELGESMNEEELEEMIQRASSSGGVTPEEFEVIMNKKLFS